MSKPIIFMFSGQGSQYFRMGYALYNENAVFRNYMDSMDETVKQFSKKSVIQYIYQDIKKGNTCDDITFTHPAIFMIEYALASTLIDYGISPDSVMGVSLGEYSAMAVSGAVDAQEMLKCVIRQAQIISEKNIQGKMLTVLYNYEKLAPEIESRRGIELASYDSNNHFVVSGNSFDIAGLESYLKANKIFFQELSVKYAFHSYMMEPLKQKYLSLFGNITFKKPEIRYISSVLGTEINSFSAEYLWQVVRKPMQFRKGASNLYSKKNCIFADIGPSGTLANLVKLNLGERDHSLAVIFMSPFSHGTKDFEKSLKILQLESDMKMKEDENSSMKNDRIPLQIDGRIISANSLGSDVFKKEFSLKYAYLGGSMYNGISSADMAVKMARSGMLSFFGAAGVSTEKVEAAILDMQNRIGDKGQFGVNLLYSTHNFQNEQNVVDLVIKYGVKNVEASAYLNITPEIVRLRLYGIHKKDNGEIIPKTRIFAKVSRTRNAEMFLNPPPENIVKTLLQENKITPEEAALSSRIPMADAITVEADSGGHTDSQPAFVIFPEIKKLCEKTAKKNGYDKIFVGFAGGIGTPEAAAAAFVAGADYIQTGSINQCTVEAGISDYAKSMLQTANVQDTELVPAGDMLELKSKVQVLKKGVFFPPRAKKISELFHRLSSLDEMDNETKLELESKYYHKTLEQVFEECKLHGSASEVQKETDDPKLKMSAVFRQYFSQSGKSAISGERDNKLNFQIMTGPAIGAFNAWVKETPLEDWENRNVDEIAIKILSAAADLLQKMYCGILTSIAE